MLLKTERLRTLDIPRRVRASRGAFWDPTVCLQFGYRVLRGIREAFEGGVEEPRKKRVVYRPEEGVVVIENVE
jgi:hypothetical protein